MLYSSGGNRLNIKSTIPYKQPPTTTSITG